MRPFIAGCLVLALAACGRPDPPYVAAVRREQPIYCYRTLAGVDCYARPFFRDERQFINHFGPPPHEFERPKPPPAVRLMPPPEVDHYCRVAEPDACPLSTAEAPAATAAEGGAPAAFSPLPDGFGDVP